MDNLKDYLNARLFNDKECEEKCINNLDDYENGS